MFHEVYIIRSFNCKPPLVAFFSTVHKNPVGWWGHF